MAKGFNWDQFDEFKPEARGPQSFDWDAHDLETPEANGVLDKVVKVAKTIDSYTGAPARAAIGALQDGKNPFSAYGQQFGEDPDHAPTGKQIAQKAGVSDRPIYDISDEQFDYLMDADPLAARDLSGLRAITRSGAAGLGIDVAADPTNLAGPAIRGVAKGGELLSKTAPAVKAIEAAGSAKRTLGEGLKGLAETAKFKSSGAMLKDFRTAADRGKVKELGRWMLDNNIGKLGDDYADIAEQAAAKTATAGERLDEVYKQASEKFKDIVDKVGFDPKRDKTEIIRAAKKELGNAVGAEDAVNKLSKYLDEIAARHGDKPLEMAQAAYKKDLEAYLPKFRNFLKQKSEYKAALGKAGEDLNQPALAGLVDDLQRTKMRPTEVELLGREPEAMRAAAAEPYQTQMFLPYLPTGAGEAERVMGSVENPFGKNLGSHLESMLSEGAQRDFLNQNTAEQISLLGRQGEIEGTGLVPRSFAAVDRPQVISQGGQTRIPILPEAPSRPVAPKDIRNPMDPRATNDIKTELDKAINYARNPLAKEPTTETAMAAARKVIAQKVDNAIEALGGDALAQELRAANKEYGFAKTIENIAKDRTSREAANRAFGLTDTIAAGAGATTGAVIGGRQEAAILAATAGLANKLARTYGPSTVAIAADRVSKYLLRTKEAQQLAKESPKVYQAVVLNFTRRVLEQPERLRAVADGEKNDSDPTPKPRQAVPPLELNEDSSSPANYKLPDGASATPLKGRDKWVASGFERVANEDPSLEPLRVAMLADPKLKTLLMQASDLKPGSKALRAKLAQIKGEIGKRRG